MISSEVKHRITYVFVLIHTHHLFSVLSENLKGTTIAADCGSRSTTLFFIVDEMLDKVILLFPSMHMTENFAA